MSGESTDRGRNRDQKKPKPKTKNQKPKTSTVFFSAPPAPKRGGVASTLMHAIIISHIHISYCTSRATYACARPSRRHARRGRRLAVAAPPRAARGLFATSSSPPLVVVVVVAVVVVAAVHRAAPPVHARLPPRLRQRRRFHAHAHRPRDRAARHAAREEAPHEPLPGREHLREPAV